MESVETLTDTASAAEVKRHGNPRIARYDKYYDLRTSSYRLRKTAKPKKFKYRKGAIIVVQRVINDKGLHVDTEVEIKSEALLQVLMEINHDVDGLSLAPDSRETDTSLFFHSIAGLRNRIDIELQRTPQDTVLVEEIKTAIEFTLEEHGGTFAKLEGLVSRGEITFDLLWALIPPNTLVYRYDDLTEQSQILLARQLSIENRQGQIYASVACDSIYNGGEVFGIVQSEFTIAAFRGARKIQELPLFPLSLHDKRDEIATNALSRGRKLALLQKPQYYELTGAAKREYGRNISKFMVHGRVMIDATAFCYFNPGSNFILRVQTRLDRDNLTEEQFMICSPVILGFCFGSKQWGGFAMDRIREIVWSDEPYQSLVLDPDQKKLILSLVKQQSERAKALDDFVQGKGKGLVGLLSGRPGCGKTLTAEAVAEVLKQPLYTVSAGELGTSPEVVDDRLSRILELAQTWNAVLLLDEAEVFLQLRSGDNVKRNALVSIFLRQLEYYQGILILTTNLITHIDPAFESRLHFCVHYPDLTFESRKKIWETFFRKAMCDANGDDINRFAERPMNGRQIKNAVISAKSIAMEGKENMTAKHVDAVLGIAHSWELAKATA